MARVNVSDASWVEFRSVCLAKGEHVADAIGRLVEADLERSRSSRGKVPQARKAGRPADRGTRLFDVDGF